MYRRNLLLASTTCLASGLGPAWAADLPVRKAEPVEYVRVCNAYGAGFFYIPGTDTCLRLSGRARFEFGHQAPKNRVPGGTGTGTGDTFGYRTQARINLDARTQTAYGTLRAFLRLEAGSRTGFPSMHSATGIRIGNTIAATGVDGYGRVAQFLSTDKAFIQFAGLTAGRASSYYDFYAHDYEFIQTTTNSNVGSTNLAAYTAVLGNGWSATLSMEDPSFRRSPIYSSQAVAQATALGSSTALAFAQTNALTPLFVGYTALGEPSGLGFVDVVQRNRMPDFVGVVRYDQTWGSAQLSAAVHELNTGSSALGTFIGTNLGSALSNTNLRTVGRTASEYGWAVQAGVKVNLPMIAPGDAFYLQGSYSEGAQMYAGYSSYTGSYATNPSTIQGAAFAPFLNDAVLNPFTNRLELSNSFTIVGSYLHYWSAQWRSAFFASYGELSFAPGSRAAQGQFYGLTATGPGTPGTRFFALSQILRDTYKFAAGLNLIWSPVKDLDIGVEGMYHRYGLQSGRVLDLSAYPGQTAAYVNNLQNPVFTKTFEDVFQVRARVQRDF